MTAGETSKLQALSTTNRMDVHHPGRVQCTTLCTNSGNSDGENAADMDGCDCDAKYWMDREIGG